MLPCLLVALRGSHTHAEIVSACGQAKCPLCTIVTVPCGAWLVLSSQYSEGGSPGHQWGWLWSLGMKTGP